MNAKFLITASFLAFAMTANAETQKSAMKMADKSFIKPYLGVGSFHIAGAADDFSAKGGIVAGATYEMPTSVENLSVDTGLEYLQAGAQREYVWVNSGNTAIKQEVNMDYIAIPLKARYQFLSQEAKAVSYKAIGGITVAQLISAKSKTEVFGQSDESDLMGDFNHTDILASVGVGAEYDMLGCKTSLDIEYTRGMLAVSKEAGGNNEGFIVKAGFAMPL
jgi:hypothetical protein